MTPQEFLKREEEIRQAKLAYPTMEIGMAYAKWKLDRGEKATMLRTSDHTIDQAKREIQKKLLRPCTQSGCPGTQELESVCSGCVEGRKGFKSKWTCDECLHRELSKKEYWEWVRELISGS